MRSFTLLPTLIMVAAAALLTGCTIIAEPDTRVLSARLDEETDEGARILVEVELSHKNKVALPLVNVRYEGDIKDIGEYSGTDLPNRTLPIASTQTITLPLVYKTDEPVSGRTISISGAVTYEPPGEIRKLMTESGIRLPTTGFSGKVVIDAPPSTRPALPDAPAPGL
jgi:hypothetical protein